MAACRLVTVGEAEEQIGGEKTAVERKSEESTKLSVEHPKQKMKSMTVTLDQAANDDADLEVQNNNEEEENPKVKEAEDDPAEENRTEEIERNPEIEPRIEEMPQVERVRKAFPKPGDRIQYRVGEEWQAAEVIKRGGKARGKYYDYFNVRDDGKEDKGIYLDKVDWRFEEKEDQVKDQVGEKEDPNNVEEEESDFEDAEEEANVAVIPVKEHNKPECVEAKKKELEAFDKFGAYVET